MMDIKKYGFAIIAVIFSVIVTGIVVIHYSKKNMDLPQLLNDGRLYVLTDSSSLGFCQQSGKVCGFQYEIAKAFADTLGVELVISKEEDFDKCVDLIKNGDYHIIANMIPTTIEREHDLSFTIPFQHARLMLVQATSQDSTANNLIHTYDELNKDTIYVTAHSPHIFRLKNLSNEIAQSFTILEDQSSSIEQLIEKVSQYKIKMTVCDEISAKAFKRKYPNIDVSLPLGFSQPMSWAVNSKSNLLRKELNDFIEDYINSPAYWELYRRYH